MKRRTRILLLCLSIWMLLFSTVQTTAALVIASTDPLINTFMPLHALDGSLVISKRVEHTLGDDYVIPESILFDFEVDLGEAYANQRLKTTSGILQSDAEGKLSLQVRPGGQVIIYELEPGSEVMIKEIQKAGDGFKVQGDAVQYTQIPEAGCAEVQFVNTYHPSKAYGKMISLYVEKELKGREWMPEDAFTFTLKQKQADQWVELGSQTMTYAHRDTPLDFSEYIHHTAFKETGVYTFALVEQKGSLDFIQYDESIQYFTVTVTDLDMDGQLEVSDVTGNQRFENSYDEASGQYILSTVFQNTYVEPQRPPIEDLNLTIFIEKALRNDSKQQVSLKGFQFVLQDDTGAQIASAQTNTDGYGKIYLKYSEADIGKTYSYKLFELNDGRKNIQYSDAVYNIRIDLYLNEDGRLAAECYMNEVSTHSLIARFENKVIVSDAGEQPETETPEHNPEQKPEKDPTKPPTYDQSNLMLWVMLTVISAMACIVLMVWKEEEA